MGGKIRAPVLGDFLISDEIMNSELGQSSVDLIYLQMFFGVWRNAVRASSIILLPCTQKRNIRLGGDLYRVDILPKEKKEKTLNPSFQVISSIILSHLMLFIYLAYSKLYLPNFLLGKYVISLFTIRKINRPS